MVPYFYWPLIGPRTTRDTFGWMVDTYYDPVWRLDDVPLRNSLVGTRYIDMRASLLPSDKVVEEAAFEKYNYIRDAYLQHRRSELFDGELPREALEDESSNPAGTQP
jgi:phospholipid-binding lipoprotein MlaA